MKLLRIGEPGRERPVVADSSGQAYDAGAIVDDFDPAFLAGDGLGRLATALAAGRLPRTDVADRRVGPPLNRPGAILCIGMNYAAHAAETGAEPPEHPVLFYKSPHTVVGAYDPLIRPRNSDRLDWEVELAVVIGRRASYLDAADDASSYVAGYCISDDVSERRWQLEISGGQWSKGKNAESFNPLGPWIITPDELSDPGNLRLQSWVNGEARQDSSTKDLIFSVSQLIYQLSQITVLEPGDIINTGTPHGVALSGRFPYLEPGDVLELEIEGLGRQRQRVVQA